MPTTNATNPNGAESADKNICVRVLAHPLGTLSIGGTMLGGVMGSICVGIKCHLPPIHSLCLELRAIITSSYRVLVGCVSLVFL
ncbi:hypothetical protein NHP21005_10500 [Helicobacter sp. NHP21005]|nr:hypothetical protein NHP21005_10500 [Helicobacter sp. NHP21005]